MVEWWDAVGPQDPESGKPIRPALAKTVGFMYEDAEQYVTIAAEVFEEDETFRAATTIPRCSISAVSDLRIVVATPEEPAKGVV